MRFIVIALWFFLSLSPAAAQVGANNERIRDSIEISQTTWVADSVEFAGNPQCVHEWINGDEFWSNLRNSAFLARKDSAALRAIPPQRILPRICSKCLRKEYLFERTEKRKIESEYTKLQRQMLLEKGKH
jgi:hypothetical protein